ncbi:hypothetical protein F4813DRAFT_63157 [Daldinia decipiens]|uniref:uncharacterized protein n=1 Tax=Daldinia decipiens TaxID=326647 RepID=UPI0020C2B5AD|nr:uncharacterized protein F4813DRAFT_63157 [Daldinia decipiens]KAI1657878.1 hypothetical protein F4813DRAFT_63157 [Daldinia decipiens]
MHRPSLFLQWGILLICLLVAHTSLVLLPFSPTSPSFERRRSACFCPTDRSVGRLISTYLVDKYAGLALYQVLLVTPANAVFGLLLFRRLVHLSHWPFSCVQFCCLTAAFEHAKPHIDV